MERTDHWVPKMHNPPLGRSYLVVVPSYDMTSVLIFVTGLFGLDFMADTNINPSSMGSIFGGVDGTDHLGPKMVHPPLGRSYLKAVSSYDMSGAFILLN